VGPHPSLPCPACSPPTALRLLEEFVQLEEGDTIIQNGANSAVGKVREGCCAALGRRHVICQGGW
jgi:NADPH:quinone reductase-like Zn-dependent oxidoreductase